MSRNRAHDPERDASLYLGGAMRTRASKAFEEHLVSCESCWHEVSAARRGRAVAESLRELAPQDLREDVRAAVASAAREEAGVADARPRRRVALAFAAALALAVAGSAVWLTRAPSQPREIAAAVRAFRSHTLPVAGASVRSAPDLTSIGLSLAGSGSGPVGGIDVQAFAYHDAGGHPVVVYLADRPFPEPARAWGTDRTGSRWRAEYDGVQMLCVARPVTLLVMSDRADLLERIAAAVQA